MQRNKKNRDYLAGLSGVLSAGAMCRDVWNRAENKREKWAPQEQRLEAEHSTMHSLHADAAVLHSKFSPSRVWELLVPHSRHTWLRRDSPVYTEMIHFCSLLRRPGWRQRWNSKRCEKLSSRGEKLPCKTWYGSDGMGVDAKQRRKNFSSRSLKYQYPSLLHNNVELKI